MEKISWRRIWPHLTIELILIIAVVIGGFFLFQYGSAIQQRNQEIRILEDKIEAGKEERQKLRQKEQILRLQLSYTLQKLKKQRENYEKIDDYPDTDSAFADFWAD